LKRKKLGYERRRKRRLGKMLNPSSRVLGGEEGEE
jgi:hypothetical protein